MAMTVNKMRTRVGAAVLAALIFWTPFYAFPPVQASPEHSSSDRLDSSYFKKFRLDFGEVVTSPARWGSGDFLRFSALVGTGLLIYGFDKEIYDWVQRQKSSASLDASQVISKFGNGVYLAAFMTALYVSGEVFDSSGLRKTALLSLESFLTTTAFVLALKVAAGRARPNTGESSHSFYPFSFSTGHTSFPSGDAAGAFAVASIIADQSPGILVDALAYGLAGLVAVYRVHDRKHWPSDVFAGSALGFFVGKKIAHLNEKDPSGNYRVAFQLTPHRQAITLILSF